MTHQSTEQRPVVIGLGELLWDLFPEGRRAGGAPANFAFHAHQMGAWGRPASCVGTDPLGTELIDLLQQHGLDTGLIQQTTDWPTGTVSVQLDSRGHAEYVIHEHVAWDQLEPRPELLEAARLADAICFGTLGQRSPRSRDTIGEVLRQARPDCLIVFDVNLRQQYFSRELIEASLRFCRVVKLNDEEVRQLTRLLQLETSPGDLPGFAREISQRFGPRLVCITRGGAGALLVGEETVVDIPGRPVDVVDTVGAGDSFTAALVVSLLQGYELQRCGELANRVGALVASRSGAMPDLRREYQLLQREILEHS